jgi:hypothetical protein
LAIRIKNDAPLEFAVGQISQQRKHDRIEGDSCAPVLKP